MQQKPTIEEIQQLQKALNQPCPRCGELMILRGKHQSGWLELYRYCLDCNFQEFDCSAEEDISSSSTDEQLAE